MPETDSARPRVSTTPGPVPADGGRVRLTHGPQRPDSTTPAPERAGNHLPLRAKPEFYRKSLYAILSDSTGMEDAARNARRIVDKLESTQAKQLGRDLRPEESRAVRLAAFRDMRVALLALSVLIGSQGRATETYMRRSKNVVYLRWSVEREILMLHWRIDQRALEERQMRSGLRMPRFLEESLNLEGLG
ncbi:MAG: hypothetical protein NTW86_20825 [Candidatus Sumerlaeota bacterium]|nr:hypothetical protein [Candidatus Sumerlaeota bacterium]